MAPHALVDPGALRRRRPRNVQRYDATWPLQPPSGFTEWAPLAQDRAGWQKLVIEPPFNLVSSSCDNQEMTYGRSLQRHLAHFNLPAAFKPRWVEQARGRAPLPTW